MTPTRLRSATSTPNCSATSPMLRRSSARRPTVHAVAAAIESRRDWDDAALAALQRSALDAGAVLRRLAAAVAESSDDD